MARTARAPTELGQKRHIYATKNCTGRPRAEMAMRVAIIGCGLIGHKRARALPADVKLVAVADTNHSRAVQLAAQYPGCEVEPEWQSCVARPDVELIFVATVNAALA